MQRFLVTGAAGFIGSHLVTRLRRTGATVLGVDRRPFDDPAYFQVDLADPGESGTLHQLVREVDVVFHLAGRPGVRDRTPGVDRLRHRDNVEATRVLLDLVPRSVPVIVTSSSSVYGGAHRRGGGVRPCRETDPLNPRGGYARSKAEMERLCDARREAGFPVTVVRPFTVAGPGQRPDMALATWIAAARQGHPLRVLGSPQRMRDVTDVAEVVRGLLLVAETGFVGTLNLGTGRGVRLIEMVEAVLEVVGQPAPIVVEPAGGEEVEATLADPARCAETLGFVPRTDLIDLVRRQAAASLPGEGRDREASVPGFSEAAASRIEAPSAAIPDAR